MVIKQYGVLICAHNEASFIGDVVQSVLKQNPSEIIVIDDGSTDHTAQLAQQAGATVIRNRKNLGKGSSLKRGFRTLLQKDLDAIIVVDGDSQHDPSEIPIFLETFNRTGIPILIGSRMSNTKGMPFIRKKTNQFMAFILNKLVKIYIPDPPCGFRFYSTEVLPFIISDEQRFAFEFDILLKASERNIRIDSVRISTIYSDRKHSHIAPVRDSWLFIKVVWRHLFNKNEY